MAIDTPAGDTAPTPEAPQREPQRRTKVGRVISDKMNKTVVVAVESFHKHPIYQRTMRRTKHFKAHDDANECHVGDEVEITESRPMSKDKHHVVSRVIRRAQS